MSERKRIYYSFKTIEAYQAVGEELRQIIEKDTGSEAWICNRALPPTCYPPPMTEGAIEELKKLDGVVVGYIDDD
ncbi:hypothetical protein BDV25DRAFT_138265 [Aspergillus avenaceus]|uniref:Uncharacterized protein n=1 Tax=Aspergillus avenaceus TaxID=36643 RepID=A0A5N6U1I0_ASPAV|nr:hypothetical protein BDV25DRAFT_138265 [Aspergillus avenaceus]